MSKQIPEFTQEPSPGSHQLMHRGDLLTVSLEVPAAAKGVAFLRTNLGSAVKQRREIISHVEQGSPLSAQDWHDIPMTLTAPRKHTVVVPLLEVGKFEAKAFLLPEDKSESLWPEGANTIIKVEPAEYCCANTMYSAFVRQFGPNKVEWSMRDESRVVELENEGYSVIPRSGTFRDLIGELDFIMGRLRSRIIQLLPIHPVPTTYARMGRFGSPFAVLDFTDVEPALAEFDRRTTPLEQFCELVDAVHRRGGKLLIDIPINHTGWSSKLQIDHPEWFARGPERSFESPGAWGVTWEDLAKLDYDNVDLWRYMASVFLFWCARGVDGFRCDAGYMVPLPVWQYIVAKVRLHYPDTLFILEGLGGSMEVLNRLLVDADLDWAYSELFQNYDRSQVQSYLPGAVDTSLTSGVLVHFAETHDNNRLAGRGNTYARMRTALAALCSVEGAFGITNGVEWFATEKVDVHGAVPLNWGSDENQVDHIARLNAILEIHPCFQPGAELELVTRGVANAIALARCSGDGAHRLLVAVNLDHERPGEVRWPSAATADGSGLVDLLTGRDIAPEKAAGEAGYSLEPGEVLCLSGERAWLDEIESVLTVGPVLPRRIREQRLRAKALEVYRYCRPQADLAEVDARELGEELAADPTAFCAGLSEAGPTSVVRWTWPRDARRVVPVPSDALLCVGAEDAFALELWNGGGIMRRECSLPGDDGSEFTVVIPPPEASGCRLHMAVHEPEGTRHVRSEVLYLDADRDTSVATCLARRQVEELGSYAVCTNGRGAMAQVRGVWADIRSQYDCLLAANLHPDYPVDRHVMLTRCRAWLVYRGFSQELGVENMHDFSADGAGARWRFRVPTGAGRTILLTVVLKMIEGRNAVLLDFLRGAAGSDPECLADNEEVKLIIRPDIEDRVNHAKTKAYAGAERAWPRSISARKTGFTFAPAADRRLDVSVSKGAYSQEPEWQYSVAHPEEAERGLDGCSDLFSPGYFSVLLAGGDRCTLSAAVDANGSGAVPSVADNDGPAVPMDLDAELVRALRQFVVRRGDGRTVIAGYPWFLDWGRDTLICLRGMIAAGMHEEACSIITEFGRLEKGGTLPNMLHGGDDSDRDTSDAPLWFFVACQDWIESQGSAAGPELLDQDCGGRKLRDVLVSIAEHYVSGTANGIRMDPDTGLIFSPSHFTWMDTNHPAGTPRRGYPVEVQALWHCALGLMSELRPDGEWASLRERAKASIMVRFPICGGSFLSDCLHAESGVGAEDAVPDDHLRPNQLLAVTLGAVTDADLCRNVLRACEELLVPGAIRSLADRGVGFELPVRHGGRLLNDPARPYWGRYEGDEDTRRKPAYHNGTAWTWLFPSYPEALCAVYGDPARDAALSILGSSRHVMARGCVGQIPEILDGDSPHPARGCGAQAWGIAELLRVLRLLTRKPR